MSNFFSRELRLGAQLAADTLVIECRRYRRQGNRWSVQIVDGFSGRTKIIGSNINAQQVRDLLAGGGL